MIENNLLEEGLIKLGIFEDRAFLLLSRYIEEIELFNPAYGLVKVQDQKELIVKHILDSLAALPVLRGLSFNSLADIGSGAGLPGIPLAICLPEAEISLVERMGRRAGFLRNTVAVLGLANVNVAEAEMEKLSAVFDIVTFRAFKPFDARLLKNLKRLIAPNGCIVAYKGKRLSIEEEIAAIIPPGKKAPNANNPSSFWEIIQLEVPFLEEERHLVLIRGEAKLGENSLK